MTNPYNAPAAASILQTNPRWRLRFLLLNAILIAIPKILLLSTYLWLRFGTEMEEDLLTGDPVLLQHVVWIEIRFWPAIAYFLIPNVALLGMYLHWLRGRRGSISN